MKRLFFSTILIAAGLLAGLGVAEGLVRLLAPHSRDHVVPAGMFAIDSALGWRLNPHSVARHRTRYFNAEYRINSLGFRDRERAAQRRDSVVRVLVFGDSQAFGWGVNVSQRFSGVVEARLQSLEAWNMAVPGYGLDQQVLSYEKTGGGIPAHAAIFYASTSTLMRMKFGFLYGKPKPRLIIDSAGKALLIPPQKRSAAITDGLYRLLSRFYLPYFVEAQLTQFGNRRSPGTATVDARSVLDSAALELAEGALLQARASADRRGQRIIVLASLPESGLERLHAFCGANGITLISTGWAQTPSNLVFGKSDRHWLPEAHARIAARLIPVLPR